MVEVPVPRVLLLEPNAPLRSAVQVVLAAERYEVQTCSSLEQILAYTDGHPDTVALVAWQSMEGLLAEEHRHHLIELTRRVRLILMVPRRWARLLERTDLGLTLAGIVAKPFEADELLQAIRRAQVATVGLN
jgi:DNA-binding response OmpR family regulator